MQQSQLVDRFGRPHTYLRIAVTDRCNLRCRYCMPQTNIPWIPTADLLTDDEIVSLADLFAKLGITKIRLTGGEPTVRPNCEHLVRRLVNLPGISTMAMTTNGTNLKEMAGRLKSAGLTSLNISLDTLRPDRFRTITGRDRLADVLAGIEASLDAGFTRLRINTVVMRHVNDDELMELVSLAKANPVCVRFIEFMPSYATPETSDTLVSCEEMKQRIEMHLDLTPLQSNGSSPSNSEQSVAKEYAVAGYVGTIGFITPMTDHFCDRCNRLRLTADGHLKSCLFYPAETSVKDALRRGVSTGELFDLICATLNGKKEYPPQADRIITAAAPGMFAVGG